MAWSSKIEPVKIAFPTFWNKIQTHLEILQTISAVNYTFQLNLLKLTKQSIRHQEHRLLSTTLVMWKTNKMDDMDWIINLKYVKSYKTTLKFAEIFMMPIFGKGKLPEQGRTWKSSASSRICRITCFPISLLPNVHQQPVKEKLQ